MEYLIRTTNVKPGRMDDFVAEWTAHIARIRRRRGFTIVGAWTLEGTDRFMWILGYDGDEGFAAADAAYHACDERVSLDPDPARLIDSVEDNAGHRVV